MSLPIKAAAVKNYEKSAINGKIGSVVNFLSRDM
jgi:hypothetical protein